MRARLRKNVTYANVMSTIAVFIVLGGGAYAAAKLPKNSVGTKQIKNRAVTKAKLARGLSTKGAKGDTGARGPGGEQGPQGAQGIQGIQGAQGERGPSSGQVDNGGAGELDTVAPSTLATLSLTGDSVLTGKTLLVNQGTAATVACSLSQSGAVDPIDISAVTLAAGASQTLTLTGGAPASPSAVTFACRNTSGGAVNAQNTRLTAVTVGSLTIG